MPEISAQQVKELRDTTGAGMMDCKEALAECEGDAEKAVDALRKKGLADLAKKSGRAANEGIIGCLVSDDGSVGVLVEVNCETDFVARNEDFKAFVGEIAAHIAESAPADVDALMAQPLSGDASMTMEQYLGERVGKIGENLRISRFARYALDGATGVEMGYIHGVGNIGVLIEVVADMPDVASADGFKTLARDIAMQIAAMRAGWLHRDHVPADVIEAERAIYAEQAAQSGKPENVVDRIVGGKLDKFCGQVCLLEQDFVKEDKKTVAQHIEAEAKQLGGDIEIRRFERFEVGETSGE